jgi:thioredoxin 1
MIDKNQGEVAVLFAASWCAPCKAFKPAFVQLEQVHQEKKFIIADIDEHSDLAAEVGIRGVPTLVLFKDGKEVGRIASGLNKAKAETLLKAE